METLLTFLAGFIFILIIITGFFLFTSVTKWKVPDVIKKRVEQVVNKPTVIVDNKIDKLTEKQISQNAIDLFNYKHSKFLKNLDNSINYCLENEKFILADNVTKYKKVYLQLYQIKTNLEKEKKDYKTDETFLLKSIHLDNLNKIIQTTN
tara:strand:- start:123 stop:572 length:450 start_codon:yes stop_codon:yes gene_type:complete